MITINILNLTLLRNAEHVQYHTNVRNIIEQAGSEECGVSDFIYDPYRHAISDEQDIVNKSAGSAYTPLMQAADKERDLIYRRIIRRLQVTELCDPTSDQGKLWSTIQSNLMAPYGSQVTQKPMQEKTSVLTGFILDCRTALTSQELTSLGVSKDIDDLEVANMNFSNLYQQRVAEQAAVSPEASKKMRQETDECFKLFMAALNFNANDPNPQKKVQAQTCQEVITKINKVTEDARQRLNYRLNANRAFVDKVVINEQENLVFPMPMEEVVSLDIQGNKLTEDNVKVSILEKPLNGGQSRHVTYIVSEFLYRFGGVAEVTKNEDTGIETMVITGFTPSGLSSATIEKVGV